MHLCLMRDYKHVSARENILVRTLRKGLEALAVVEPEFHFNKVAVDSIIFKINKRF